MKAYTEEERATLIEHAKSWIADAEELRNEIPFGLDDGTEKELSLIKVALEALERPPVAALVLPDDENGNPEGFIAWYERHFALQPYKGSSHVSDCEDAWRAALRLNATVPAEEKK